jgi:hypothetical protein
MNINSRLMPSIIEQSEEKNTATLIERKIFSLDNIIYIYQVVKSIFVWHLDQEEKT